MSQEAIGKKLAVAAILLKAHKKQGQQKKLPVGGVGGWNVGVACEGAIAFMPQFCSHQVFAKCDFFVQCKRRMICDDFCVWKCWLLVLGCSVVRGSSE